MGDHDLPGTCLTSLPEHQFTDDVRDILLHYFGCLREGNREAFYATLKPHQKDRINVEKARIREHRALFDRDHEELMLLFKSSLGLFRDSMKNRRNRQPIAEPEPEPEPAVNPPGSSEVARKSYHGLNAHMILFQDAKPYRDPNYPEAFPNQKLPVNDLLDRQNATNPLVRKCPKNMIRYFHLPANNMSWVEDAIACHYDEEKPQYDGFFRRPAKPSKSYMMLRPEFWQGQQHGGRNDAVHARHMRPRCDVISTDPELTEPFPNNLVLFMPYLHWETDRRRSKFEEIIRVLTEDHKRQEDEKLLHRRSNVMAKPKTRQNGVAPHATPSPSAAGRYRLLSRLKPGRSHGPIENEQSDDMPPVNYRIFHSLTDVVEAKVADHKRSAKPAGCRVIMPNTILGKVLFRAAILADAMEIYYDEELVRKDLHNRPPLHPRRTLDQSYYWTLRSTKKRDRDQVVYRGTAPMKDFVHHHNCPKDPQDCDHRHCGWTPKAPCRQCLQDIRKVPRVVMVDQLWLWILDGNTIITCFPKRWGRNKPDPSAVHKALRLRLKVARKDEIRSVYDLALIIIDQCSRVFFDRTKTADRQPPVMDLFASAIGDISHRQTIAFEHFWYYTRQASEIYKVKNPGEMASMANALLDINPEGKLVREIKDIIDELNMMIHIKKLQEKVLKDFMKYAGHAWNQEGESLGGSELSSNSRSDATLQNGTTIQQVVRCWRNGYAHDIKAELEDRVADLLNLKESAENAEKALNGLLSLKQQQASVVHAREAVRQAEETLRQGRSIMLFTVVTIIFLPLSFFSSIFGMNTLEFNNGNMSIHDQIILMLPISFAIIIACFIFAFSSFIRAVISFVVSISWTYFVTSTPIYDMWIDFRINSSTLTEKRKEYVQRMKDRERRKRQARHEAEKERKEKETRKREAELVDLPRRRQNVEHLPADYVGGSAEQNV